MPATGNTIEIDYILSDVKAASQKQLFQVLAREIAPLTGLPPRDIFDRLMDRERMATSGIGDGVSIPHMKFRRIDRPYIIFAKLEKSLEFDALDGLPVDMLCLVMSPMNDGPFHLQRLSKISRLLRNPELRERIRETSDIDLIRSLFTDPGLMMAA